MQKNIEKWKENKRNETVIAKQNVTFGINVAIFALWTALVLAVAFYSYIRRDEAVNVLAVEAAEKVADRYVLGQEVGLIFKDLYFSSAKLPFENNSSEGESSLDEDLLQEHMNATRLSPVINELFAEKGVYVSFVGNKLFKEGSRPDSWTRAALEELEEGEHSVYEIVELHNAPYLRTLFAARVLQRHKNFPANEKVPDFFKNNKVGTLYSGVSVYYPLTALLAIEFKKFYISCALLFLLWAFGASCVVIFGGRFINLISKYTLLKSKVSLAQSETKKELDVYQRDIKKLELEKEEALKDRSQFFAKVSHEIRTPLNGILGMSELLLRTKLSDEQSFQVASLRASANNLLDVFNDIWDYSRMEAGNLQVDSQPFALRDTLYSVIKIYSHQANSKGLELIANIAPHIPDNLLGDPTRIRQVLSNLLSNAIKFTDRGEVVLSVSETSFVDDVAKVSFTVRDTGIGISSEKRLAIMSSEQMHDGSSKRKYEGLGLGLAISSRLVTLMGGKLNVDSEQGKGSSFSFTLNLPYLPGVSQEKSNSANVLKGEHVLIVDDNATNRRILREQVKEWGMVSSDCTGVDEALRLLQVSTNSYTPFSVVISDLQMPEKDGIDLVQEMKRTPALAQIPVILLSSAILGTDMAKELFFASLYKPAKPSELIKALAAAVNHKAHFDKDSAPQIVHDEKHVKSDHSFKVLLVEDLEINKLVVSSILRELGHEVSVAKDGQEALDVIARDEFDIVLMDINMPVMDGLQAVKIIRENEANDVTGKRLPVIALTANADGDARVGFMKAGFDSYILKPAAIQDLHYEIERTAQKYNIPSRQRSDEKKNSLHKQQFQSVTPVPHEPKVEVKQDKQDKQDKPSSYAMPSIAANIGSGISAKPSTVIGQKVIETFDFRPKESKAKDVALERIEPVNAESKSPNTNFEPSIFSSNKTMPLGKNDKTNEPSIAKNIQPIEQKPLKIDLEKLSKTEVELSKPNTANIDSSKFAPSIQIDKEKFAPTSLINVEKEVKAENNSSLSLGEDNNLTIEIINKGEQESMDTSNQDVTTHFSNGKERIVNPPIDAQLLTKSFASYPDLAYRSIEIFLRDAPKSLVEIKNALEIDDNSTLTVSAHAVKGLISYYSKASVYDLALKLEHMGRDKFLPAQKSAVEATLAEFEQVFEELLTAMKVYME